MSDPAFPTPAVNPEGVYLPLHHMGPTKREYFAAAALSMLDMNLVREEAMARRIMMPEMIAQVAVAYADALIAELAK